jgi:hypothetical protein
MLWRNGSLVPAAGVIVATIGLLASQLMAQPDPGGANNWCDGHCSQQQLSCSGSKMRCCCDIGGTWTCVCKYPTDRNTGNDCQDGGGEN